jgi:hypothetical protein
MQLDKFSEESVGLVESGITDFSLVHDACKAQHVNDIALSLPQQYCLRYLLHFPHIEHGTNSTAI